MGTRILQTIVTVMIFSTAYFMCLFFFVRGADLAASMQPQDIHRMIVVSCGCTGILALLHMRGISERWQTEADLHRLRTDVELIRTRMDYLEDDLCPEFEQDREESAGCTERVGVTCTGDDP